MASLETCTPPLWSDSTDPSTGIAHRGSTLRACLQPYSTYGKVEDSSCLPSRSLRQSRSTRATRTFSRPSSNPRREGSSSRTSCPVSWRKANSRASKTFTDLWTARRVNQEFVSFSSPDERTHEEQLSSL